jgi:DNA polymerase-3 subunit gamma/tau
MENNIVLYRKYRPQDFSEVIGQQHIVQTLTNAIKAASISHAYLFTGPRGSGKTSIARIFAKAINCQKPKHAEPCGTCASCQEISLANSMDLIEIDAASHTGVDDVRELISGIAFAPVKSKYKIFIIDECHQLSKSASNALLKTLEEPPSHVIFILATTEAHKMLPTIISRCQRFDFKRLQIPEIVKKLELIAKKEDVNFENEALSLIAVHGRGSFRDAESLLDKCIHFSAKGSKVSVKDIQELLGIVETAEVSQLVDFIMRQDAKGALTHINALADQGLDMQEFAKTLISYLRQGLLIKIDPQFLTVQNSGLSQEELVVLQQQTQAASEKELQKMLESFIEAENKMKYASIVSLPLELAIIDIIFKEG